jgi:hypothetical protein
MSSIVGYLTCVPDDGFSFDCPRTPPATAHVVASSIVMVSARLIVGIRMVSVLSHFQQRIADVDHPGAGEPPISSLFGMLSDRATGSPLLNVVFFS